MGKAQILGLLSVMTIILRMEMAVMSFEILRLTGNARMEQTHSQINESV